VGGRVGGKIKMNANTIMIQNVSSFNFAPELAHSLSVIAVVAASGTVKFDL
jgi:hypothetical protein